MLKHSVGNLHQQSVHPALPGGEQSFHESNMAASLGHNKNEVGVPLSFCYREGCVCMGGVGGGGGGGAGGIE